MPGADDYIARHKRLLLNLADVTAAVVQMHRLLVYMGSELGRERQSLKEWYS